MGSVSSWSLLRRVLTRPGAILVIVCAIAVAVSDWPWGILSSFWLKHPMVVGLVTSLVFVFIAIAILNAWNSERDEMRWRYVLDSSYRALIQSVCACRDTLVMLVLGEYPFCQVVAGERPAINPAILSEVNTFSRGLNRYDALLELMQRPNWVEAAYQSLREMELDGSRVLAQWAALMVASDRLAWAFGQVALFTDAIVQLERPFARVHRDQTTNAITALARREVAAQMWDDLITAAIKIEEALSADTGRRDAKGGPWRTAGRQLLSDRGQRELVRCDAGDRQALSHAELERARDKLRNEYSSTLEVISATQTAGQNPPRESGNL